MDSLNEKCNVNKWWMPLVWATNIVNRARQENRLKSDPGMQTVLQEISNIRHGLTSVQHFDTLSVPLVYTQVCHEFYFISFKFWVGNLYVKSVSILVNMNSLIRDIKQRLCILNTF